MASSAFQDPDPGDSGDLKIPKRWNPLISVRWHKSWMASQCKFGVIISNDAYSESCQRHISEDHRSTYLLHLQDELVNRARFWCELSTVPNWHRSCDICCITVPLTACINKQDLRFELLSPSVGEIVLILMVVRVNRTPREFTIIAAVMESGGARGSGHDR